MIATPTSRWHRPDGTLPGSGATDYGRAYQEGRESAYAAYALVPPLSTARDTKSVGSVGETLARRLAARRRRATSARPAGSASDDHLVLRRFQGGCDLADGPAQPLIGGEEPIDVRVMLIDQSDIPFPVRRDPASSASG